MSKVSIIIPTYNRAKYLPEAIDSVLNQTYKDFEIIVVDDGSTDNTKMVLTAYGDKIRYIYKANGGPSSARNFGVMKSTGAYIAFLDSDDLWLPEKLELQIAYLDKKNDFSAVFTDCEWVRDGNLIRVSNFRKYRPSDGFVLKETIRNPCAAQSFLLKREVFNSVLFNETLRIGEDCEFILRLAQKFKIGLITAPLVRIRRHDSNITRDKELICSNDTAVMYEESLARLSNTFVKYPEFMLTNGKDIRSGMSLLYLDYGIDLCLANRFSEARQKMRTSFKCKPTLAALINLLKTFLPPKMKEIIRNILR